MQSDFSLVQPDGNPKSDSYLIYPYSITPVSTSTLLAPVVTNI